MRTTVMVFLMGFCLALPAHAQQGKKCFFESDCPKGFACVTPKGAMNGSCQARNSMVEDDQNKIKVNSIIGDEDRCTFNTDCPDGGQCVKQPGALYGKCEGSGYGTTPISNSILDQKRTCYFDQDCRPGQRCTKPQGSFKGACEDDFFQDPTVNNSKDPKSLLQNQFRTSNKKCLQNGDCTLRETCVTQERSVFGVCTPKAVIDAQKTNPLLTPSPTPTNDPFKF